MHVAIAILVGKNSYERDNYFYNIKKADNCTFISVYGCIDYADCITNCVFQKCHRVLSDSFIIDNCFFCRCQDVIRSSYIFDIKIEFSQFLNCYAPCVTYKEAVFRKDSQSCVIEYCEFINTSLMGNSSIIALSRGAGNESKINVIKNCIFNGVALCIEYLIEPLTLYEKAKPYDKVILIENCDFLNCTSQIDLIKKQIKYDKLFKKDLDFDAVSIYDCKGLANMNKGVSRADSDQYVVKETNTSGDLIGSEMSRVYSEDQLMDPVANNVPIGAYKLIQSFGEFK